MSTEVREELDRIDQNIANTYNVLEQAGAEMPQSRNSNNLPETAASISAVLYGKAQSLTPEQQKQARKNIGVGENSGIHIGPGAPTDENVNVWVDTDENPENAPPSGGSVSLSDKDCLSALIETDMLPAVHDLDGKILTNENGSVILRY